MISTRFRSAGILTTMALTAGVVAAVAGGGPSLPQPGVPAAAFAVLASDGSGEGPSAWPASDGSGEGPSDRPTSDGSGEGPSDRPTSDGSGEGPSDRPTSDGSGEGPSGQG
ncbi:hypothetical protein [Streptomyces bohaiensis]|uniref:Uncharacterized protein n=1 Tax=Streptomyces bohaiensis TaxID=1431344 RepID=A0ABX1C9E8_9ACTN|nr:hypothetical protein [Streptomyces bohaiensis]NJQ14876.1 hypothetical protein [Streptomyces bohaiensis]